MDLNHRLSRNPVLILLIILLIPIAGTLFSELIMFDLPGNEVQDLVAFMTVTGLTSSLLSYAFYRLGVLEWFRSLRWAIWMVIALLVLMIFLNVWVIARFTFIQQHYLAPDVGAPGLRRPLGADHRFLRLQNNDRSTKQTERCHPIACRP